VVGRFVFWDMSSRKVSVQGSFAPSLEDLVRESHPYRRLACLVPFERLCAPMRACYSRLGRAGYPVEAVFKALLLQWMEDLSDRELERFLEENMAAKLFCGFGLCEATPDYSTFSAARSRIGLSRVAAFFNAVRDSLKEAGLVREVFTFVDATQLVSKLDLWQERDKAVKAGMDRLDNLTVSQLASDKDARFGRKGRTKWFGYKLHVAVDMAQGFVARIAATPANVEDGPAARHVLPRQGMVLADKAYSLGKAKLEMRRRGLHSGAILRRDMVGKNYEKDRFLRRLRMPYEGTFARFEKRARYRGLYKAQFQAFMQALSHNVKRLLALGASLDRGPSCA
jgi:IS5 family transposase